MTPTTAPHKVPILEPQYMEINKKYTFTVSPDDSYQFFDQLGSERITKATNHMQSILDKNHFLDIDLWIDVSRTGRIHWHGTILFKHINHIRLFYEELVHEWTKKHQLEIDTIADEGKWTEYCQKVKHLWNVNIKPDNKFLRKLRKQDKIFHKPIDSYDY